jgi:hypothetical protein
MLPDTPGGRRRAEGLCLGWVPTAGDPPSRHTAPYPWLGRPPCSTLIKDYKKNQRGITPQECQDSQGVRIAWISIKGNLYWFLNF